MFLFIYDSVMKYENKPTMCYYPVQFDERSENDKYYTEPINPQTVLPNSFGQEPIALCRREPNMIPDPRQSTYLNMVLPTLLSVRTAPMTVERERGQNPYTSPRYVVLPSGSSWKYSYLPTRECKDINDSSLDRRQHERGYPQASLVENH